MKLNGLDHVVLTVRDVGTTVSFYRDILHMEAREYLPGRYALHFGRQKLNLHDASNLPDPNVRHATPGSTDLCLLTQDPIADWETWLTSQGIRLLGPPVERTGAQGKILSIYFYDPDENLIEIGEELSS